MAQVTIQVSGNRKLVGVDAKNRLKIDETSLEGIVGLEKGFGFSDYRELIGRGIIQPGMTVSVWNGFVNPDGLIVYSRTDYRAVDEHTLNREGDFSYNPKKILGGINWWYK